MLDNKCIFCKIINGEIESYKIFEDNNTIAFLDKFPIAYGHTLVIPKNHIGRIEELDHSETTSLFSTLQKIVGPILQAFNSTASTIGINDGKDAGQVIPHIHLHIIPRSKDDGGGNIHSIINSNITIDEKKMSELTKKIKDNIINEDVI